MKEKDIQTIFGRKNDVYGVFELKLCKKKSLPFNAVADHQLYYLERCEKGEFYYKIPDMAAADGYSSRKPFDCFRLGETPAYVVAVWYEPRKRKTAYYIRVKKFIEMRDYCDRKSFNEELAKSFCEQKREF